MGISAQQRLFVSHYLVDLNAAGAAVLAGYSRATASQIGYNLLKKEGIRREVERQIMDRLERLRVTQDDVVEGLLREARLEGEGSTHAARVSAWGLLGKHLGMFADKREVGGGVIDGRLVVRFEGEGVTYSEVKEG